MASEIILFSISILPVLIIGLFVYKRDKNKEAVRLLAKLFFGGIAACFFTIIASMILQELISFFARDANTLRQFELVIYVFVGVALIEELCKWIMVYKISYYDLEFDEFYDMIVYCVFVALGFAFFENLFYVYDSGLETGLIRAISAVPAHACNGFFMGYYLGLAKIYDMRNYNILKRKNLFLSLLVPIICHGIYDYCLFNGDLSYIFVFFAFIVCLFSYTIIKIVKISKLRE